MMKNIFAFLPLFAFLSCQKLDVVTPQFVPKPQRIVSINPCIDAILMEIADYDQIIGLSHYSFDEASSSIDVQKARLFTPLSGSAEEIIALNPDLVLSGSHVSVQTIQQLNRLNIPILSVGSPQSIAEGKAQIKEIAEKIGKKERGDKFLKRIDLAIENADANKNSRPKAIMFQSGGIVPGVGTLGDEVMRVAGFDNVATLYSQSPYNVLTLEKMLNNPPKIMLSGRNGKNGGRVLNHPILEKSKSKIYVADFPSKYLNCAASNIIPSLTRLKEIKSQFLEIQNSMKTEMR